jgi:isopenicillin N synthase-like dioxygenase
MGWVPEIDLRTSDAAAQIGRACSDVGFLTIVGHGIADATLAALWETAEAFFALPDREREAVAMPYPGYPYGYSRLAGETLAASLGHEASADRKHSFAIGPVRQPSHTFADADEEFAWAANLWPTALPAMRPAWEAAYNAFSDLAARLLSLMATALRLPAGYFDPLIDRHTSAMRALQYPASDGELDANALGASAHTDYGTLTVLLADHTQRGLQVADRNGVWHDVVPPPGALVVNLGDAMAQWTNDRWRSTMHRVVVPSHTRQSIAFFHNANWDAVIEALPTCVGPDEPPRHAPIAAGPHLMHKFRSTVNPNTTPKGAPE